MYFTCLYSSTKACTLKYVNKSFQHHVPSTKDFLTTIFFLQVKLYQLKPTTYHQKVPSKPWQLFRMTCCKHGKVTIPMYKISLDKCIHHQWQSNPKHLDTLAISRQFKTFQSKQLTVH